MKKIKNLAVVVIMMTLCAVLFASCSEKYTDENRIEPEPIDTSVRLLKCSVPRIDYNTSGVVQTRGINGTPEGMIDILSYHKAVWLYGGKDTIVHTYTGRFMQKFYDVKRTRYAHNIDIFKNPVMSAQSLQGDSILWTVTFKDTDTHDFDISILEMPAEYENDTYDVHGQPQKLCKNAWVTRELIDSKINPTDSPDDKYNAYIVDLYFQFGVEEGPDNKKTCMVTLPLVLVPKGGPDVPIPDDKHDVISFEEVDKGYDLVNDSINNRWIDLVKVLSNGTREPFPRVAFVSKNHLFAPEYQIKQVSDFNWESQIAKAFEATPSGDFAKRENNIYVQPMSQVFTTYTDKGNCVFTGDFDGQAYFVDSLNQKHYFLYKEYTFEDDGWQKSNMEPTENFERVLLTSDMRGFFNGAELPRKGEIELRKLKDTEKKIIGYEYPDNEKGIKPLTPNTFWTWRIQYILFSDNSKEKVGEIGTTLNLNTTAPERQVVTVTDWDIQDLTARPYDAVRGESRTDKIETGEFTIRSWSKNFETRTNKSSDKFVTTYDGTVIFKDKYGQEVEFIGLAVKQEDKGGVATLKDLLEQNGYERKEMTTSIAVTETNTSTSANHTAEIEFHKAKPEAPKLVGYEYENFDIKTVVPNKQYFTYCTRYAVKSDNTRENLGTFGTDLYINVDEPAKQTITVTDWNINDLSAVLGSAVDKGSRNDVKDEGTFKISKSEKSYTTKTNKSECKFVITYEGTVTFTDTFGKEVNFKGITFDTKDNGGVKTLKELAEQNDMQRKEMTSNITVTVNSTDAANYNGVVEFQKAVEKEELTDWKVTSQDLVYNGNGNWTSTTTVTYYWKLAGSKTETYNTGLIWNIVGEAKSQIILNEAKADYKNLNAGNETSSSATNGNITVVTKTKAYSEDYTTLTDKYTATMQTASYKAVVDGKTIAFDFLAPSSMVVSHGDGSLVDGNRTTKKDGVEYNVWDHAGTVTAQVTSSVGNQTESAKDEKEILVKKEDPIVIPDHPEWGRPLKIIGQGTFVYRPGVGPNGQGVFHENFNVLYEKGVLCLVTTSYVAKNYTNPMDFSYTESDFYPFGTQLRGKTITEKNATDLNSAIWRDGKFEPAHCDVTGEAWTYISPDGKDQGMTQQLAETCGLKNFTGQHTAYLQPWLYFTSVVAADKTLLIRNSKGATIARLR